MTQKGGARGTFVVQIVNDQNATWQGTVNWLEKKKNIPFRSTLELIKLIDGALESGDVGNKSSPGETGGGP